MILTAIAGTAALASLSVCVAAVYNRDTQKSIYFNLLALAVTFYSIGTFLEITSRSVEAAIVGMRMSYLGIPFIPPLWYLCVREYCGKKTVSMATILGILAFPVFTVFLAYTWESNHLLFTGFEYQVGIYISQLHFSNGALYLPSQLYMYFFNFLGMITIVLNYAKGTRGFKRQAVFFFVSALIPVFSTMTYLVHINNILVDITPYGLAVTMFLFFVTLHKYGMENFSAILKDSVLNDMHEGIMLFDKDGIYMDSNKMVKEIFPQTKNVPIGTGIEEMSYLPFDKSILTSESGHVSEFSKEYHDCIRTYSISISHVRRNNTLLGHSIIIYNITPFKNMMSELEIKAHMDTLTGIYNRGFFFERSNYELEKALLTRTPLSAIMLDLDFFKQVNDTYGHAYGDYILKTVAGIGHQSLRKTDIFGRYGGEEFCILLPGTDLEGAHEKAEAFRKQIQTYVFEHDGIISSITASFGVAEFDFNLPGDTLDALIKRADENMYKAKAGGRNKVV